MLTAPYTSAMRLGQGFNTYTHEICVNDAVVVDPANPGGDVYGGDEHTVSQIVSYCTRHVDKVSQVIAAMNISAAASVKTQGAGGGLAGSYVDSDTFKESNINFFCQVKVTNQVIMSNDLLQFNDISTLRMSQPQQFTKVYGDSFISGFIEGGELNAIISVKTTDQATINSIKASLEGSFGKGAFSANLKGEGGKDNEQSLSQSETTITVNWTGGGIIKPKEELWSISSLVKAAAAFPEMVAHTPQRTHAILTKYENLRSYYFLTPPMPAPLNYSLAELYTNDLLDAFTDYKSIWTVIHQLAEAVEFGHATLKEAEPMPVHDEKHRHEDDCVLVDFNAEDLSQEQKAKAYDELRSKSAFRHTGKRYKATLQDLDRARYHCRLEMGKILNEIIAMENDPSKASTADPSAVFLNPAIFRKLLPVKVENDSSAPKAITEAFYLTSEKALPNAANEWKNKIPLENTQRLRMTGYGGENDTKVSDRFVQTLFQNTNGVTTRSPVTTRLEYIKVYSSAECVTGIDMKYVGLPAVLVGKNQGQGEVAELVSNDPVTEVVIQSAKYKGQEANHAVILGITLKTRGGASHTFGRKDANKDKLAGYSSYIAKGPTTSWGLLGFWVSLADNADEGFARLGAFFAQDL